MLLSRWIATLFCLAVRNVTSVVAMSLGVLLVTTTTMAEDVLPFADEAAQPIVIEPGTTGSSVPVLRVPEAAASVDLPPAGNSEPVTPDASLGASSEGTPSASAKKPADTSAAHASVTPTVPAQENVAPSKAEQLNQLRTTIEADQSRIEELRARLVDPASEYNEADAEFREADRILQLGRRRIEELTAAKKSAEVAALKQPFEEAQANWDRAHERFEVAIQTRETEKARIIALEEKIQHDVEALDRLMGNRKEEPSQTGSDGKATHGTATGATSTGGDITLASDRGTNSVSAPET